MKEIWRFTIGLALLLGNASVQAQSLINVDTGDGNKTGGAVVGSAGGNFNKYYPDDGMGGLFGNGVLVPLYDAANVNTGAGLLMYNVGGEGTTGWGDEMFDYYLSSSTTNLHLYVTNASGLFDLYLYGHGANDAEISIFDVSSGSTYYGRKQTGSDYDPSTSLPYWNDGYQTWVENQNYVKFSDVSIPLGANLLIEVLQNSGGDAIINGFQLQGKTVPAGDWDGDGIANATEISGGLDPWNPDSDDDGVNDGQEQNTDLTDPLDWSSRVDQMLTLWNFDDAGTWSGNGGQSPITTANLNSVTGVTNGAVEIHSSGGNAAKLIYKRFETNAKINATANHGSFRFLFRPTWGTAGGGPGSVARLLDMGLPSSGATDGSWTFFVSADGSTLKFVTRSGGVKREHLSASINWTSLQWYELVLDYTPNTNALYIDGVKVASGSGVTGFIKTGDLSIGSDGGDGAVTAAQWVDDPSFSHQDTLWEWDDNLQDYVAGYWTGTWVSDPNHPNAYFRDAYDYCWNQVVSETGYWQGTANGENGSAKGAFDELATFNYPIMTPVGTAPEIVTEPTGQTIDEGDPFTLSVTATGTSPLSYQWYLDGNIISGATASTYSVSSSQSGDDGDYTVVVSNAIGSDTSSVATVTVVPPGQPPVVTVAPVSQNVAMLGALNLNVTAVGEGPFSYQWQFNGIAISGETASTINVSAADRQDAGAYRVVVSNAHGSVISTSALITVSGGANDADGDGLSDAEEQTLGTSSSSADTDGDGVSDLEEVKAGRNPNGSAAVDVNNTTQLVVFTPLQP